MLHRLRGWHRKGAARCAWMSAQSASGAGISWGSWCGGGARHAKLSPGCERADHNSHKTMLWMLSNLASLCNEPPAGNAKGAPACLPPPRCCRLSAMRPLPSLPPASTLPTTTAPGRTPSSALGTNVSCRHVSAAAACTPFASVHTTHAPATLFTSAITSCPSSGVASARGAMRAKPCGSSDKSTRCESLSSAITVQRTS